MLNDSLLNLKIKDIEIEILEKIDGFNFDVKRAEILKSLETIDVQACPGSGKTTLIAAKLKLLSKKWPYKNRGICVLSHTNVAKDEIINQIKSSKVTEAKRLIYYPHFIGTIQDFVGRFLALPLIRNEHGFTKFLENDEGFREVMNSGEDLDSICKSVYRKCGKASYDDIKKYLGSLFWVNGDLDLGFYWKRGLLRFNNSHKTYQKLSSLKNKLISNGYYQYRDMYAYSEKLITMNKLIKEIIQKRFPLLIVDEMQDTREYQEDLLQKIFPSDCKSIILQRFGDPDQEIYDLNHENPNRSFNGKSISDMNFVIEKSHRFDTSISKKIKCFSFNEMKLDTDLSNVQLEERKSYHSDNKEFKHTIFIYGDSSIDKVIPEFAKLVDNQFIDNIKNMDSFTVKAIGAVGNEIELDKDQLKIGHYFDGYDKKKIKNNFKETCLIEAIYFIRQHFEEDWSEGYKYLNDCILRLLRLAGIKDDEGINFNANSFKKNLIDKKIWDSYRKTLFSLMNNENQLTTEEWQKICTTLIKLFSLRLADKKVDEYLKYLSLDQMTGDKALVKNLFIGGCIKVEISTIHGVKGETHDATLILETKYYTHDVHAMLPYLTKERPAEIYPNIKLKRAPTNVKNVEKMANQKFMRQLYVAMSRPKHLLCIAAHKDRITEKYINSLNKVGWSIVSL